MIHYNFFQVLSIFHFSYCLWIWFMTLFLYHFVNHLFLCNFLTYISLKSVFSRSQHHQKNWFPALCWKQLPIWIKVPYIDSLWLIGSSRTQIDKDFYFLDFNLWSSINDHLSFFFYWDWFQTLKIWCFWCIFSLKSGLVLRFLWFWESNSHYDRRL